MPSPRVLAACALAASGCSILYDADDLRKVPPDAYQPAIDADPSLLIVTGTEPSELVEGVGADGGRPQLVVIQGSSMINATVTATLDPDGTPVPIEIVEQLVSLQMDELTVALRVPVLEDLAAGDPRTLRFTVTQDGAEPATVDATVLGLEELTLDTSPVAEAALLDLYSRITISADVHFTGTEPVQLRATGGITIAGVVDVDAAGTMGGAHGCAGGGPTQPGGCGNGGGRAGASTDLLGNGAGGGGGGFGVTADTGGGDGGGAGGEQSGSDMLVPIRTGSGAGNRGNGGGGGGAGTLNSGGAGGGGGGVIELTAGGAITFDGGSVRAKGGDGTAAGAGGGGGSGGAILVRAGGEITGANASLSAPGGAGADGAGTSDGAPGTIGRIRIDSPTGGVGAMADTPTAVAGPSWDSESPTIVTTQQVELTLRGASGRSFAILVDDDVTDETGMPGASGTDTITLDLSIGRHRICAAYAASGDFSSPEATSCIDVAYIFRP